MIDRFIRTESSYTLAPFPRIVLQRCQFDVAQYVDADYDRHAIARPAFFAQAVASRRAEYLAGRYCAAQALRRRDSADLHVGTGLLRAPQWPAGFAGSITHAHGQALAAVARHSDHAQIGIDLERLIKDPAARNLDELIVSADERTLLAAAGLESARALTLAFSAKESFFKAVSLAVGHYFEFRDMAIVALAPEQATLRLSVVTALSPDFPPGRSFLAHYDWLADDLLLTAVVC